MKDFQRQLQVLESKLKKNDNDLKSTYDSILVIGEFFKSSYGPNSLNKLLYDKEKNHIEITNDGLTLVKELLDRTDNPIVKKLLKTAKEYGDHYGDGVKRLILTVSTLLKTSVDLLEQGIPRNIILESLSLFRRRVISLLKSQALERDETQNVCERILLPIILPKLPEGYCWQIIELIKTAYQSNETSYMHNLNVEDIFQFVLIPGSTISETKLINGLILDKEEKFTDGFPNGKIKDVRVLISSEKLYFEERDKEDGELPFQIECDPSLINNTQGQSNNKDNFRKYFDPLSSAYNKRAKRIVQILKKHNVELLVTEKGIDKNLENLLLQNEICYVRRIKMGQLKLLSQFLSIDICQNISGLEESADNTSNFEEKYIGKCEYVEYKKIGRDRRFLFSRAYNKSIKSDNTNTSANNEKFPTFLIGGSTWNICKNIKDLTVQSLKTLMQIKNDGKLLAGIYQPYYSIMDGISTYALRFDSKKQICIGEFNNIFQRLYIEYLYDRTNGPNSLKVEDQVKITKSILNNSENRKQGEYSFGKYKSIVKNKGLNQSYSRINKFDLMFLSPFDASISLFNSAIEFLIMLLRVDHVIPYQKSATNDN